MGGPPVQPSYRSLPKAPSHVSFSTQLPRARCRDIGMDNAIRPTSLPCPSHDRARSIALEYPQGMTTADLIAAKAKALSPEGQREVLDFVRFLHGRSSRGIPYKSLAGVWSDLGVDLSTEDIDEARREAWSDFPRKGL
jgi:hypothetical protein